MLLPDFKIKELAERGMIDPFVDHSVSHQHGRKVMSFGLSSYGYDMRLADEFKVFVPGRGEPAEIDPKNFNAKNVLDFKGQRCTIPPNSFVLARSMEYWKIPPDVLAVCLGKSSYARAGIVVGITPMEPLWRGHLTIEISNTAPAPAVVYANEGIAQALFFQSEPCETAYAAKGGRYQDQQGIVLPR